MQRTHCPACATKTLTAYSIDDHELEKCSQCHGLWFDEPELIAYIDAHRDKPDALNSFSLLNDATHQGKSQQHCHDCNQAMTQYAILPNDPTVIDACHRCDTFWVSRENIQRVQYSHDLRDALTRINAGFTWRSWFFQILMKMPVEYNAKPRTTPWVTYGLILLNILFFLPFFISPGLRDWTFYNLSIVTPVHDPAWFLGNLISAQFMHGSLMHIVGNCYFLWIIGDNIEDALGKKRFILAYLCTGIVGMLLEAGFAISESRESILLGASAAVSGLFGMYIVWFKHAKLSVMLIVYQLRLPAYWFLGIWVITNLFGFFSGSEGVAYLAHLGGFVAGLAFALVYRAKVYQDNPLLALLNNKPDKKTTETVVS